MSDKEVVITEFKVELDRMQGQLESAAAAVSNLAIEEKRAAKAADDLDKSLGSASEKVARHRANAEAAKRATEKLAEATGELAQEIEEVAEAVKDADLSGMTTEGKALTAVVTALGKRASEAMSDLQNAAEDAGDAIAEAVGELAKTPEGAKVLAQDLGDVQKEAIGALRSAGAIREENEQLIEAAAKVAQAQVEVTEEASRTAEKYVQVRQEASAAVRELEQAISAEPARQVAEANKEAAAATTQAADALNKYGLSADEAKQRSRELSEIILEQRRITLEFEQELAGVKKRMDELPRGGAGWLSLEKRARQLEEAIKDNRSALKELGIERAELDLIAKSFDKSEKGSKSLVVRLREARNELAQLIEQSDGKISPELLAAAERAGDLHRQMVEVRATVEAFNPDMRFRTWAGVIQNVAGGLTALTGVMGLLGQQSETTVQTLTKVQSALAVTQGLQALFGSFTTNLRNVRMLLVASAGGTQAFAGALGVARAAMAALNTAIAANPIGAVSLAVGGLVLGLRALRSEAKATVPDVDALTQSLERLGGARLERVRADAAIDNARRELELNNQLLALERERSQVQSSNLTDAQKQIKLLDIEARASALRRADEERKLRQEYTITGETAITAARKQAVLGEQLRQAFAQVGVEFRETWSRTTKEIEEGARVGIDFGRNEAAMLEARAKLRRRFTDEQLADLDRLEAAFQAERAAELSAIERQEAIQSQLRSASIQAEIERTREQAAQTQTRIKLAEEEERRKLEARAQALREWEELNRRLTAQTEAEDQIAEFLAQAELSRTEQALDIMRQRHEQERKEAEDHGKDLAELYQQQAAEQAPLLAAIRAAELAEIQKHYEQQYALADQYGLDTADLILSNEAAINAAKERFRQEDLQAERDALSKSNEQVQSSLAERAVLFAEAYSQILGSFGSVIAQVQQADDERTRAEIDNINARIEAARREGQDTAALEEQKAQAEERARRQAAQAARQQAMVQALAALATAMAEAVNTASKGGDPYTVAPRIFAALAAVVAAGIQIRRSLAAIPGFAEGGEVKSGWGPRIRRANGDNVLATLKTNEIVLNEDQRRKAESVFGQGLWGWMGVPGFHNSVDWTRAMAKVGSGGQGQSVRMDPRMMAVLSGVGSISEQKKQTRLLEMLVENRGRRNPRV